MENQEQMEQLIPVKFNRAWANPNTFFAPDGKQITFGEAALASAKTGVSPLQMMKIYAVDENAELPESLVVKLEQDILECYNPVPGILNQFQVEAGQAKLVRIPVVSRL